MIPELGSGALTALSTTQLLQRACDLACAVLGVEYANVLHQPGRSDSLVLVAGSGWGDDVRVGYTTVPRGRESHEASSLETANTVVVDDFSREDRFAPSQLLIDHGVMSGMSVAIPDADRPYGVLTVHSRRPRAYPPEEATFLREVAGIVGGAIQNDRTRLFWI